MGKAANAVRPACHRFRTRIHRRVALHPTQGAVDRKPGETQYHPPAFRAAATRTSPVILRHPRGVYRRVYCHTRGRPAARTRSHRAPDDHRLLRPYGNTTTNTRSYPLARLSYADGERPD